MKSLGRHILVEYYGCDPNLMNDVSYIETEMINAATDASATVINSTFHHFSPWGVSGVVVIQESHLAIHTWPEYEYCAVDIYTCGEMDPWVAYKILKEKFRAESGSAIEIGRGQLDLLEKTDFSVQEVREQAAMRKNPEKYTRNVWITDKDDNIALSLRHTGERLFNRKSDYQLVEVFDTYAFGKTLYIDKMAMTSDRDEFIYHEMITHPAMQTKKDVRRVLVIGGGDGGAVRELLRYESVEKVVMVEIDQVVIDACRVHFPQIASEFGNPRLELIVGDGIKYIEKAPDNGFDLIIVDSSDPVGPSEGLFSYDFYRNVYRCLTPDGIMVAQTESPHFNRETFIAIYKCYREIFGNENVHSYMAFIPTYPTGMWSFSYCSKGKVHPLLDFNDAETGTFCRKHGLKYYNESLHRGAFAIPTFVREMIS